MIILKLRIVEFSVMQRSRDRAQYPYTRLEWSRGVWESHPLVLHRIPASREASSWSATRMAY